jgi:hypothetical protein
MKINRLETKKSRGKTTVFIEFEVRSIEGDTWEDDHAFITRKVMWNTWLLKHIVTFCPWDFGYNSNLFADSLKETGRNLIENGNSVNHVKDGRQALQAAGMLHKLDSNDIPEGLDTLDNLWERRITHFEPVPGTEYSEMVETHQYDNAMGMDRQEYGDKMFKINSAKHKKYEEGLWKDTWDFISRRARRFWD